MAIKTTRWRPDTCNCTVTYDWDNTTPADVRVHTLNRVESKCPDHTSLTDAQVWAALTDENPRKNKTINAIITNFPTWKRTVIGPSGDAFDEIIPSKLPTITWDKSVGGAPRVMRINIPGRTVAERTTLQTLVNTLLGNGKVVVV